MTIRGKLTIIHASKDVKISSLRSEREVGKIGLKIGKIGLKIGKIGNLATIGGGFF